MPAQLKILTPQDYRVQELTPPAQEPVLLPDIRSHLRISDDAQDADLAVLATTARCLCEQYTGRMLVTRTLAVFLDHWPHQQRHAWWDGVREGIVTPDKAAVRLPVSPIQSVDAIYLHDTQGGVRILAADQYVFDRLGARLSILDADFSDLRAMNAVEIRITAGYGVASDVPMVYKQAIRQLTAHLFSHRGDDGEAALLRCGAAALLAPFREVSLR